MPEQGNITDPISDGGTPRVVIVIKPRHLLSCIVAIQKADTCMSVQVACISNIR